MFETHRRRPDPSEAFAASGIPATSQTLSLGDWEAQECEEPDVWQEDEEEEETFEWADVNGGIYLLRTKRAANARKAPGAASNATQGAIQQFRNIPNGRPKSKGVREMSCLRCGQPVHFWRQCTHPFSSKLGSQNNRRKEFRVEGQCQG